MAEVTIHYCGFDQGWDGKCKTTTDGTLCDRHRDLKCSGCGAAATKLCSHTGIQVVCGEPLCNNCDHGPPPEGSKNWFGMAGGHAPLRESYRLWAAYYERTGDPQAAEIYRDGIKRIDAGEPE